MHSSSTLDSAQNDSPSTSSYRFTLVEHPRRLRAEIDGVVIADSVHVKVMEETRLPPVYYFPATDVRMDLMQRTDHRTYCPFKGNASYWTLRVNERVLENVAWGYEDAQSEADGIRGHVAFYADRLDGWFEDEQRSEPAIPTVNHNADRNPLLPWLMQVAPTCANATALTHSFAEALDSTGVGLVRVSVLIRTLHPQLVGTTYRWSRKSRTMEPLQLAYDVLQSPQFLDSPLLPILEGAGGVRRRLDGDDPVLDFGILKDLHEEGATDYAAMPMLFSNGQINAVTIASDRPGGFATSDLGHVYEILAMLGSLYEVHAMRYTAVTLLDTYLGRHAGARVLNGHITRGDGESIEAVIWFCDLRESTPLAQSMSRAEFLQTLNQYFDCMAGAVLAHGGQVLRFIGDAALAIFPITGEDEAAAQTHVEAGTAQERAFAAALDARERMRVLNEQRTQKGVKTLGYGLALHQGEVTYGNIGTAERLEFTVIGDAANRAARIESQCKVLGHAVLASSDFAKHFPVQFSSLGSHALRGVEEVVEIFALHEAG